jgi:hypothetical protein
MRQRRAAMAARNAGFSRALSARAFTSRWPMAGSAAQCGTRPHRSRSACRAPFRSRTTSTSLPGAMLYRGASGGSALTPNRVKSRRSGRERPKRPHTRCEMRDARCEMRDARCEMRDARAQGLGLSGPTRNWKRAPGTSPSARFAAAGGVAATSQPPAPAPSAELLRPQRPQHPAPRTCFHPVPSTY